MTSLFQRHSEASIEMDHRSLSYDQPKRCVCVLMCVCLCVYVCVCVFLSVSEMLDAAELLALFLTQKGA